MSLEFESLADRFYHKNIVPLKDAAKRSEKVDFNKEASQSSFQNVENDITQIAKKMFDVIKKSYYMMKIANMKIPESRVTIAENYSPQSRRAFDFFLFFAKEGIYAKYIKATAKQTENELELNRLENRIKKHRENLDRQFRVYIQKLKQKK